MYKGTVYPNYLSGTGYVMSRDVVQRLYQAALKTPLFHLEDVYLTGLCAHAAGIKPRHHPAFTYNKRRLDPCLYRDKTVITSHRVNGSELRKVSSVTEWYIILKVVVTDIWHVHVVAVINIIEIYTTETKIQGFHGGKNLDCSRESLSSCRSLSVLS